jgi:hypothetical protein
MTMKGGTTMYCVTAHSSAAAIAAALVTILVACADPPARAETGLSHAVHTTVQHHVQTHGQENVEPQKSLGAVGDRIRDEVRRWFGLTKLACVPMEW